MKKVLCLILCAAICCPTFAAAGAVEPSRVYKIEIGHSFYAYDSLERVDVSKRILFGAQTVTVLEQKDNNKYLIATYLGPKWIILYDGYSKIVDPYKPYGYEQQIKDSIALESMYPEIIDVGEIGESVEGRQIISVKLGKGPRSMIMVGSHHAREYITSTFLMKMIDEYAYAYYNGGSFGGYNIKKLLDSVTIHAVVMLNPDGVNLVQNGPETVKDKEALSKIGMSKDTYSEWKSNINGVNLNINYPAEWDKKDSLDVPDSEKFKGYSAGSEPETKALMEYTKQNNFLLAASMHSKGEVIYWADKKTQNTIKNQKTLARVISRVTGYKLCPVSQNPKVYAAGYENWFRADQKRPAFCIELTPHNNSSIPHDDADFDKLVWNKAGNLGAALAEECLKMK